MKQLSTLLFLLTISFLSRSQTAAETHNFITYDTSYNIGYANLGYQIRITRPANLFTPNSPDTASRPVIIHMSGVGEIGTNSSVTATYGPHYWLANGWDGGITLGNGKHYPIIITIQPWAAWPGTTELLTVLNYLLKNYHIKRNAVHLTGLSMGAFSWTALICHQSTPGAEDGMKIVTSIAALEGQSTNVSPGVVVNELPGFQSFAVWAQKYNGKFFGLEGITDYRNVAAVSQAMNAVVPGSAYFSYENIGGGAHCCWNSMYDPSVTNWTSVGTLGPNNATQADPNTMGTYKAPCNIFTWMLRQGDTSLVGASSSTSTATANAGSNQTLSAGTSSTTLSGALSLGSLLSYSWTQVSGPNTAKIASPSSVTTAITGLITGTYVFTLKVSTVLGISASAQVSIVVSAPANIAPTANAGADISMTLPTNTATLSGSGADQDGTIKTYVWSQVSGPSQAGLSDKGNGTAYLTSLVAGTYVFRLTVTDNAGATATDDITIVVNSSQLSSSAPPTPTYISVPGIVQAESYASMSGIGTETTTDNGGGLDVGWIDNKDWMTYNINTAAAGSYVLTFRVASPYSGASFQVQNSAGTVLATVNPDNTGGWQNWESITATVTLPAGNQALTLVSTSTNGWNLNWIQVAAAASTPSTGKAIPGVIQAEDYDLMSGVQTETTGDTGGGEDVGWIDQGDLMKYNVTVATAGAYTASFRVATIYTGAVVQLRNSSGAILGSVTLSSTGSFQAWTTVSTTVQLPAGAQTLEIYSPNTLNWNINWMNFVAQTGASTPSSGSSSSSGSTTTNTGVGGATPTLVPGRVEAEKYYEVYGTLTQANASASGGANQGWIDNGNWMAYIFNVPTAGTYRVNFRVSTVNDGGVIQMKTPTGSVLLTLSVPNSGDWNTWETVSGTVTLPAGIQTMVVWNNAAPEWNFDWMEIVNNTANAAMSGAVVSGQAAMMSTASGLADPNSTFAASSALFPNPANDHTTLSLNNEHVGKMRIDVINVAGKVIRSYQYNKDQVSMQVTVATSDLPAGTYFIRVQVGDWVETQKLLKK